MPGHSRSKNGVASLAYVPGIHALLCCETKDVDGRDVVREDGATRLMPGHDARHLRIFALRIFAVPVRFTWIERTLGMFHGKCFTPNKLDFRGLENRMKKFVDRA
jgi:hypothetical protein